MKTYNLPVTFHHKAHVKGVAVLSDSNPSDGIWCALLAQSKLSCTSIVLHTQPPDLTNQLVALKNKQEGFIFKVSINTTIVLN